jgi:hypothetical protein
MLTTHGFTDITAMSVINNTGQQKMSHTPFCAILNYIYTNFRTSSVKDSLLSVIILKASRIIYMQSTKMPRQKLHTVGITFCTLALSRIQFRQSRLPGFHDNNDSGKIQRPLAALVWYQVSYVTWLKYR